MGSVDAGRQITAGGIPADLYAPADYLDIDLLMKPAGYASFNIVFARGRMVLAYSAKKTASLNAAKWYEALTAQGATVGSGNAFLDPGAYRAPMIFQLAEAYYKVPNLYNTLLGHVVIPSAGSTFQLTYEHNARATAKTDPDYKYIELPAEIDMSDPAKDVWYKQNAVVVIPGLGTPKSARAVAIPGNHVAWGITLMNEAPNKENAIKFLELLLSSDGITSLRENGPDPLTPAEVSADDFKRLPERLKPLVRVRK